MQGAAQEPALVWGQAGLPEAERLHLEPYLGGFDWGRGARGSETHGGLQRKEHGRSRDLGKSMSSDREGGE